MAKIIHDRKNCTGCSICVAVCPSMFEMSEEDRLADLKGAKKINGFYELETPDVKCAEEAADLCSARVIKITK
jgi:ferredoxin